MSYETAFNILAWYGPVYNFFSCIIFFLWAGNSVIYNSLNHKSGDSVYAFEFNNIKMPTGSIDYKAGNRAGENWTEGHECMVLFSFFKCSPPQLTSSDFKIDTCSIKRTWKL